MKMKLSYLKMLTELHNSGYSDEQIAVGMGEFFPGNSHPSSTTVYRWRTERTCPSAIFAGVIEEFWKQETKK